MFGKSKAKQNQINDKKWSNHIKIECKNRIYCSRAIKELERYENRTIDIGLTTIIIELSDN
jgi:hypothetical protein